MYKDFTYFLEDNKLMFHRKDGVIKEINDGVISVFYSQDEKCDTLIKHGNKDVVLNFKNSYEEKLKNSDFKEFFNFNYFEVPKKFYNLFNECIHYSATKKLTKLKTIVENEKNIIDVEVI